MSDLSEHIKRKLWAQFKDSSGYQVNLKGYVSKPELNLIPGVRIADFQEDLKEGSGNELKSKFLAVHSSSALVVNTFGIWKSRPHTLQLCGISGFSRIIFEKKCPTGLRGTPPNLDLLAESEANVIGVESKLLEHLSLNLPKFSESYSRDNLLYIEDKWWNLLEKNKRKGIHQHLDVAQLIKHYLGLRNQEEYRGRNVILLYLFWEPMNWNDVDVFIKHREEVRSFAEQVEDTSVCFMAQSYHELWSEWESQAESLEHLVNLRRRYLLTI